MVKINRKNKYTGISVFLAHSRSADLRRNAVRTIPRPVRDYPLVSGTLSSQQSYCLKTIGAFL